MHYDTVFGIADLIIPEMPVILQIFLPDFKNEKIVIFALNGIANSKISIRRRPYRKIFFNAVAAMM